MSFINFKLKHPSEIIPWSNMGWFALSDGEYWLNLGKVNFYEITDSAANELRKSINRFVDYNLARLIEDFSQLFENISESLPDDFYEIAKEESSLFDFYKNASDKVADLNDDTISDEDFYRIHKVLDWINQRSLSALHLIGSPTIYFFRRQDKIALVWDASSKTENGISMWTAGKGNIELNYKDFILEVENFKMKIFAAMERQIQIANSMDWESIQADKPRRLIEQTERKEDFEQKPKFLKGIYEPIPTNWEEIRQIRNELNV